LGFSKPHTPISRVRGIRSGVSRSARLAGLLRKSQQSQKDSPSGDSFGPTEHSIPTWQVPCGILCAFIAVFAMGRWGNRPSVELVAFLFILLAGFLILMGYVEAEPEDDSDGNDVLQSQYPPQHGENVSQKLLLEPLFLYYSYFSEADMANAAGRDP
jgi:hypothetical protein